MKKAFFFDIDNTLLDHQTKQIPPSALQAIDALKADGHMVVIATGRAYGHALEFIDLIQPAYAITQNGARIMRGDKEVDKHPLPGASLAKLFQLLESKGFYYGATDGYAAHVSAMVDEVLLPMESVDLSSQADLQAAQPFEIFQGWMFFHEQHDATLMPELVSAFPEFDYIRWHTTALDVLPKSVNKMTGCAWVLADAGMDAAHAYAFGDGLNDIEMLQGVGTGIAMGNAHPRLKAVADRVAEAIHHDGLAKMVAQLRQEWLGLAYAP
jgi:Cof subfamily protein (haloacid dehalogenase superfamily)